MEKSAGIQLELKDLDTSKRTAVIKHAVYNSMDRVKDVSMKEMFTRSWNAMKPDFLFNHKEGSTVGNVLRTFEDEDGAYTEVKFGNWTLGNDVLEMASEGVLKGASFGYITEKKEYGEYKGEKVRRLKEVRHIETSLLTVVPAHPDAGIMLLNKAFSNDDITLLSEWHAEQLNSMKSYVQQVEKYCSNATASDETIQFLSKQVQEYKNIISDFDTAITQPITDQVASDDENANTANTDKTPVGIITFNHY